MNIKKELVEKLEKDCEVILNQKLPKALADNNDGTYRNLVKALDSNLELIEKCKNKKVILNEIPLDEYGEIYLEQSEVEELHKVAQTALGENYMVITTPTKMSLLKGSDKVLFIDEKAYSYEELIEIIDSKKSNEKAIQGIYGIVFKNDDIKIYDNHISKISTTARRIIVSGIAFNPDFKIGIKGKLKVKYLFIDIESKEKENVDYDYDVELVDVNFSACNSSECPKETRYIFEILDKFKIDEKGNMSVNGKITFQ